MAVTKTMADVELTPSVPVTPREEVKPDVPPAEVPEKETPAAETAPQFYKLPDGREVDAAGLRQEYEKLLPEFTRKSQRLAELEGTNKDPNINNIPEWKRDGYVPKSYAEIIEIAERQALEKIAEASQAEDKHRAEIASLVDSQIATLKAKDPKLDENALFAHANKWGFRDLGAAYENYAEMRRVATVTEERVLSGLKTKTDPISTGRGSSIGSDGVSYGTNRTYSGAQEFLSRVKNNK